MNERIKELIEKSTEKVANEGKDMWIGRPHYRRVFNKEMFAELIVRECAAIAKHNVMNISTYSDAEFVSDLINQHFGVEE